MSSVEEVVGTSLACAPVLVDEFLETEVACADTDCPADGCHGEHTLLGVSPRRSSEPVKSFDPGALHRTRTERGMSMDRLAEAAAVTRANLIGYERGRIAVGVDTLVALAKALEVDPVVLLKPGSTDVQRATLADLRWAAGLSKAAVAEKLGLQWNTWNAIERGLRAFRPEVAAHVASLLGTTVDVVMAAHQRGLDNPVER